MIFRVENKWSGARLVEAHALDEAISKARDAEIGEFKTSYAENAIPGKNLEPKDLEEALVDFRPDLEPFRAELVAQEVLR
jgi:hypothetical protein